MRLYKKYHFLVIFFIISIAIFLSGCKKEVGSFQDKIHAKKMTVHYLKEDTINPQYIKNFISEDVEYFVEGVVFVPQTEGMNINLLLTEDCLQQKSTSIALIKQVLTKGGRVVVKTNEKPQLQNFFRNLGVDVHKNEFIQFLNLQKDVAGVALYLTEEGLNIGFSTLDTFKRDSVEHYQILLKGFL